MKKGFNIELSVLCILCSVLGFAACASMKAPHDDAYYWPEKTVQTAPGTPATPTVQNEPVTSITPTMEVLYERDTTITVRIIK